jgi:hypothetical protein
MNNIFNELIIPTHFFDSISNLKNDLLIYISNNLYHENYNILRWDLSIALTTNANG